MKKLLFTKPGNNTALIARLILGIVIFPHGAQKLLGWFGGGGFTGTMEFFTSNIGLPFIVGLLVILIEFFGSLLLIFGFLTRVAAAGIMGLFLGIVFTAQINNGFFMNWGMVAGKGEGLEYFLLILGLALISLISGGGKASVDAIMVKSVTRY
ncbi:MAG: DoxX family protein [Sphingobacteriaceae bacterium]